MTEKDQLKPIRLLNLGCLTAWQTQAIYHALAEMMTADSPDTLIICRPQTPYLCLGYHQPFETTFDRAECERRGLPVYRRRVGGGATYLDANQLFYQCVFHHRRVPVKADDIYAMMLAAPVATLCRLGLRGTLREVNEVEANGRRIAGIGGGRIGQACVVVGNLLFDFAYQAMAQVWHAPWPTFRQMAATALADQVTTLRQLLGSISIETVQEILLAEFAAAFERRLERRLKPGCLTEAEIDHAKTVGERLASAEYLHLHHDPHQAALVRPLKIAAGLFVHAVQAEVGGQPVRATFRVRDEMIEQVRLESGPPGRWADIEARLSGQPFRTWQQQLDPF